MQILRTFWCLPLSSAVVFLAAIVGPACGQAADQPLYYSLDGQTQIRCLITAESTGCGLHRVGAKETGFFLPESIHYNCSDDQFLCVSNLVDVFAVPRAGLQPGMRYKAYSGASLVVEQCFRKADLFCLSALISSECEKKICDCYLTPGKRIIYFYYEKGRGVVGFGASSKRFAKTNGSFPLSFLSSFFVLTAEKGFLEAEFNLDDAHTRSWDCPS